MFIPARKARDQLTVCTRLPRLLSIATTGAVFMGAGFGVMTASADPRPDHELSVAVDIVGDSYMAGEGLRDTYIDPLDPRHRSTAAPALQALARVQSDNSRLRVNANLVASAGAETADFFIAQTGPGNTVVNAPQHDQVRPDAQLVIVGFGGDDAHLATVLADARSTTSGPNTALDKEIRELGPLLDSTASDEEYLAQAKSSPPGQAPTLVARMVQVLSGIMARAPHAKVVVTTYPLAADPKNAHAASLVGEDELTSVRKFGYDLNKAIDRAVQICGCGTLADLSEAIAGHEIYTADPAFNEKPDQQAPQERFQPNDKGASLIANPIANSIANLLQITPPKPSDGRMTDPKNIDIHNGVSDRDGDTVADYQDRAPDDPTRSADTPRPDARSADETSSHHGPTANHANDTRQPRAGVLPPIIQVVDGRAPGESPIGPYNQPADPAGDNHPVTVDSRPPAREQTAPLTPTAQTTEPAAAGPVPGEDPSPAREAQNAAMRDVIYKAEPAGYVSRYSVAALRATPLPADVRGSLDKSAVDAQMSRSFLNQHNKDVGDGFRDRFSKNIDAIHNATTVAQQDAAIARFNQTAKEYNAAELAERDAYGAHPVDTLGETVRVTPKSLAEVAAEAATYGPVDPNTLSAVSDEAPARTMQAVTVADVATETTTSAQVDASTLSAVSDHAQAQSVQAQAAAGDPGPNSPSASKSVTVGPAAETGVEGTTQIGGVTVTGKADARALGGEANASGGVTEDGVTGKAAARGYLGEATVDGTAQIGSTDVSVNGKASADAEVGAHATIGTNNVDVGVNGSIGAKANVEGSTQIGPAEVGVNGKASLTAQAAANATINGDRVDLSSTVFAGAKIGVDGHVGALGADVQGTAEAWSGVGWEGRFQAGWGEDGKFTIGADAGVAALYGAKVGIRFTVDPNKFQKSIEDAVESLNPWGPVEENVPQPPPQPQPEVPTSELESLQPEQVAFVAEQPALSDQAPPSDVDSEYSGQVPASSEPGEAAAATDSTEPATDSPADSDAATSSDTDPAGEESSDTIAGESDTDTVAGDDGDDTLGGETDTGVADAGDSDSDSSDSGLGDTSDTTDGDSTSDATGGLGDDGSDSGIGGGETGDSGTGSDSGDMGDSGSTGGDSGSTGSDSGGMGDSSGTGGDSGGGDSGGGDSGGGTGGGDSSGGTGSGGMGSGSSGGDGGGGD